MTLLPAVALLLLALLCAAPFVHAAWSDARERRRNARSPVFEAEYRHVWEKPLAGDSGAVEGISE